MKEEIKRDFASMCMVVVKGISKKTGKPYQRLSIQKGSEWNSLTQELFLEQYPDNFRDWTDYTPKAE